MKKLVGIGVILVMLVTMGNIASGWVGERMLEQINRRIDEIEVKLLELDQDQLLNRLDWVDWGIANLLNDVKAMEKEIQEKRKRWEEMRSRSDLSSEAAWREWERAGRELDELDRKRTKLYSTLERLKRLRAQLQQRLKEIKAEYEPKPFALGLGVGSLKLENTSTQIWELKLRTPKIDFFYGSDGYNEEAKSFSYFGAEMPIGNFRISKNTLLRFPVGIEKLTDRNVQICAGILAEFRYKNAKQEWITGFLQLRCGIGEEALGLLIGIFF
jgi:hypothetical protein